jgi:spore coat protein U-like protein
MKSFSHSAALKVLATVAFSSLCWLDASSAMASTATSNLTVSASVSANCSISTSAVAFGAYDPIAANASAALNGTGTVTVTCTNGSAAVISLGQGSNAAGDSTDIAPTRQLSDGATHNLAYFLYQNTGRTTVWGNTEATGLGHTGTGTSTGLTVYGAISGGQNMPAGSYTDSVVATVTF